MAALLLDEGTVEAVLDLVVSLACASIDRVDDVSISLQRTLGPETTTASSDAARDVDHEQYRTGEGPCVAAMREGTTFNVVLAEETQWPNFTAAAQAAGFGSVFSTPLRTAERTVGSLNFYSRAGNRFNEDEVVAAQVFADHASVAMANAMAYATSVATNLHLQAALDGARTIGRAQGVLMARQGCTSEAAFDMLRRTSQRTNRKLREIAEDVTAPLERSHKSAS
ncbi:MAG: GAF and ANTAR domain-containing protein [Actinobacteria bacterium]|nr:GAF and ANTAR domain-containing protein [Actinomycetota bacterium]